MNKFVASIFESGEIALNNIASERNEYIRVRFIFVT